MKYILTVLLIAFCIPTVLSQAMKVGRSDLKKLASAMTGEFNNNEQADLDKSFYHVVMRMKPVWKERQDGYWFYVEQAVASSEHLPYRQRVYHLFLQDDTTILSQVYELKNPAQYAGAWKDETKLARIVPDSLIDRQGCALRLHMAVKGIFTGSTQGKECQSALRGAAYATSEVTIYPDRLISWDRGWNSQDQQVWGAEKEGYIFVKVRKWK